MIKNQGRASRSKGARGDREARKAWEAAGFDITKFSVGLIGPDYIARDPDTGRIFSVEATRDKTRIPEKLYKNLEKAALSKGIPIGRLRRDGQEAVVVLYEKDLLRLLKGDL